MHFVVVDPPYIALLRSPVRSSQHHVAGKLKRSAGNAVVVFTSMMIDETLLWAGHLEFLSSHGTTGLQL